MQCLTRVNYTRDTCRANERCLFKVVLRYEYREKVVGCQTPKIKEKTDEKKLYGHIGECRHFYFPLDLHTLAATASRLSHHRKQPHTAKRWYAWMNCRMELLQQCRLCFRIYSHDICQPIGQNLDRFRQQSAIDAHGVTSNALYAQMHLLCIINHIFCACV